MAPDPLWTSCPAARVPAEEPRQRFLSVTPFEAVWVVMAAATAKQGASLPENGRGSEIGMHLIGAGPGIVNRSLLWHALSSG
jgi:hypothetical protein